MQRAVPSDDDSDAARRFAVQRTAQVDLACPRVDIVLTFERRYANTAAVRYAVEGCGRRALYAETCEDYPRCRYLLVSVVPLGPSAE